MAKKKKIRSIVIGCLVGALVIGGGIGAFFHFRGSPDPVNVYGFNYVGMSEYWGDNANTEGMISVDNMQSVYLSSTQQVKEIFVQPGQSVKAGDPLMAFDTTLSDIELERQRITVDKTENDLNREKENLVRISNLVPYVPYVPPTPEPEPEPEPLPPMQVPLQIKGTGTEADPFIYLWNETCWYSDTLADEVVPKEVLDPDADKVSVPDVTGYSLEEASQALRDSKLYYSQTEADSDAEKGTVIDQDPAAGTLLDEGESVSLTVSKGPEIILTTTVPDVTGQSLSTASQALRDSKLYCSFTEVDSDQARGTVVYQDPAAGTELEEGSAVTLQVSKGPAEPDTPTPPDTPDPTEPTEPTDPANPDDPPTPSPAPAASKLEYKVKTAYVVFTQRQYDNTAGEILKFWGMIFTRNKDGSYKFTLYDPDPAVLVDPNAQPEEEESFDDSGYVDNSSGYTAAEIAQMRSQSEEKIRNLTTQLKVEQVKYKKMQFEMTNDTVTAQVDGVVKSVLTEDEAKMNNTPLILLSGGGGYYVTGTMGEFSLGTVSLGQEVTVMSYMSGESAVGTIVEISDQPATGGWYWSDGNQNVSYYPFKVFVSDEANFQENEYVQITYASAGASNSVYLEMPFVRSESGKSYVYVEGADHLLEKREVVTGRNLWGSYIEIKSGVTAEDFIAFPYGKTVKEGAPAKQAPIDELYSSMY
ncbi:MAG: PASTA domain-containing protein [Oscillospiraceae bacterium]|nr:PASTA domain-containing protein [Oscillospiraceae bacterium]